jgi:23S rRNA (guanine745-N1)-methyltransferase
MTSPNYQCPICHTELAFIHNVFRCAQNHCFDRAKEGYVNLLPVQFKHSKDPGDNKAMVNARREFLSAGFYQPLADRIVTIYQQYSVENNAQRSANSINILDAGCGEGYYTAHHKQLNNQVYGVDIAKEAIKIAAKKYKSCFFSVATLSQLPFTDHYFDWIYSIYAPILEQEFSRVLAENGYLLTVTPAKNHLLALKALIYEQAKEHDDEKSPIKNLTLVHQEKLSYEMSFTQSSDAMNLLEMTPFAFKKSVQLIETLAEINEKNPFFCQADFLIRLYSAKTS